MNSGRTDIQCRLSVCITHYNRNEKLRRSLDSLARQTLLPDETIVVDDASPIDPVAIVLSDEYKNLKIKYIRQQKNVGMPENLNTAINASKGGLVVNLHDADIYEPTLLEKWVKLMESEPSVGFAFCGYDSTEGGGKIWIHKDIKRVSAGTDFFSNHYLHHSSSKVWGTVIARKEAYVTLLPFRKEYGPWADVDMWIRMCAKFEVGYIPEALIILDNNSGHFREFSWRPIVCLHVIKTRNLDLFAGGVTLGWFLLCENLRFGRQVLRVLLGRLYRRKIGQFNLGLKILLHLLAPRRADSQLLNLVKE